jgi:hypothetical protein
VVSRAKPRPDEKIDTSRTSVEQMTAVFRYEGDRVTIDDAFLRGTAMGATFNGYFDLAASLVSISGTYIPIFGINNVFSRVPVVGRILGGENSEGLIGRGAAQFTPGVRQSAVGGGAGHLPEDLRVPLSRAAVAAPHPATPA